MTAQKSELDAKIGTMLGKNETSRTISRRLFLYDEVKAFQNNAERGFSILNAICEHFKVAFSAVRVAGSAHVGYSYFKSRDFTPKLSDLDVAIISPLLFQKYSEYVYSFTRRYSDQSRFLRRDGISVAQSFRENLSAGLFRPDQMPVSPLRDGWFSFFEQLSTEHSDLFKNINAGLYLSECFFEMRNESVVIAYQRANK